jgi:pimeloyl-ACP methyl ester carboxylesterase
VASIVLVHGGRHGGWCWQKVAPLLRTAGHDVWTPTLTGSGERHHLADPEVGVETHAADLLGVLEYEDLTEVVLVAHSYGGMPATVTADRAPERIGQLVYLDAVVPRDGDSVMSELSEETATALRSAAEAGGGWLVATQTPAEAYGIEDPGDIEWVGSKLTAQPLATYTEAARLTGAVDALPRTYIECLRTGRLLPPVYAERARAAGWDVRELDTGHDAMVTLPTEVAEMILEIASS